LRRAGLDVTLLGRAAHLDAIAQRGLAIAGIWGDHHVAGFAVATDPAALRGTFAAILVTVKSYDTAAMATAIAPLLAPDGVVISLQNGLGNVEALESAIGAERTLGARALLRDAGDATV